MAKSVSSASVAAVKEIKPFRHGDIPLLPVTAEVVEDKVTYQGDECIIAFGEATGHHHKLTIRKAPGVVSFVKLFKATDGNQYIRVEGAIADLTHQEHSRLEILPGLYKQNQEREYDPFMEEARRVVD